MPDDKKPQRGFLETAIAATPAAIGVGIAGKKIAQDVRTGGLVIPPEIPIVSVSRGIRRFSPPGIPPSPDRLQWFENQWTFLKGTTGGADIFKKSWVEAMETADPITRRRLSHFTENVRGMEAGEIYSSIRQTLQQNQSALMERIFGRFRRGVETYKEQYEQRGIIPTFKTVSPIRPMMSNVAVEALPPELQPYYSRISSELQKAGGQAGTITQFTRPEFAGYRSFMMRWTGPKGEDINLLVPVTHQGAFLEGTSLRTKYLSPLVGIMEEGQVTPLARHTALMREFELSILPSITGKKFATKVEMEQAINAMRSGMLHELETMTNLPSNLQLKHLQRFQGIRSQTMDIQVPRTAQEIEWLQGKTIGGWVPSTRTPTELEYAEAMRVGKLFGGVGPQQVAYGRASTFDWSQLAGAPEAMAWGRRPEQWLREYTYTRRARELAEKFGYTEDILATEAKKELFEGEALPPRLRTLYVDPKRYGEWLEKAELGEGEALMRGSLRGMMEQKYVQHAHITGMEQSLFEAIQAGAQPLQGVVLGREATSGDLIRMGDPRTQQVLAATRHHSESMGNTITLHTINRHRMRTHEKWFGSLKALGRFIDDSLFRTHIYGQDKYGITMREAGGPVVPKGFKFDVITTTEELAKNPLLHAEQITTGMAEVMRRKGTRLAEPLALMQKWSAGATLQGAYSHRAFVTQAMQHALSQGLTPGEFGMVFGAAPAALGAQEAGRALEVALGGRQGAPFAREMAKGRVTGGAQLFWGGPSELRGAGGLGSIEPRVYQMLQGGVYGDIGQDIAKDLARRSKVTEPGRFAVREELMKTLTSITGKRVSAGPGVWDIRPGQIGRVYTPTAFTEFLEQGGGLLRVGRGIPDIYVPGMEDLRALQPFTTAGGTTVKGELAGIYHGLAAAGENIGTGEIGVQGYQARLNKAVEQLWKHAAPAGGGMGGGKSQKIIGSRFLEIVTGTTGYTPSGDPNVVGVSRKRLEGMLAELEATGLYAKEELGGMRTQLEKTGRIPGLVARHPFIGQFSMQPVIFEAIEGQVDDVIAISERQARVAYRLAGDQAATTASMTMSPLLGMAADKDADIAAAFLVDPKTAKRIGKNLQMANNEFSSAYVQHQMRLQMLKAKAGAGAETLMSIEEKMIAETRKIGVVQRWTPRLSVELTQARQAILTSGLKGQRAADAMFLLEWLEQTPISAKHMSAREIAAGHLPAQLEAISGALERYDATTLQQEVAKILDKNPAAARLLKEDIHIQDATEVERLTGVKVGNILRSMDLERTSRDTVEALRGFEKSGQKRLAQLMTAQGTPIRPQRELPLMLNTLSSTAGKAFSQVTQGKLAARNVAAKIGRGIIEHRKPLAIGFAGSLAIAMAMSSPEETIGPGIGLNAALKANVKSPGKAADRMMPEDMVPSQAVGRPTAPSMMNQNQVRLSGPAPNYRTQIRARSRYGVNSSAMADNIARVTNNSRSVNLNIRDNRSGVNHYVFGNKMLG